MKYGGGLITIFSENSNRRNEIEITFPELNFVLMNA